MFNTNRKLVIAAMLAGLFFGQSMLIADEYYSGGATVNIDRVVNGYLWIDDATVNLYKNAHIKTVVSGWQGSLYSCSGCVLNIYGGKIDDALYITTSYNSLPEAKVTVYGYGFAVGGVSVPAGTPEVYIPYKTLSGFYEDGTPFSYTVDCYAEAGFYMTIKLGWVNSEPEMTVTPAGLEFGSVRVGSSASQLVHISNTGDANLTLQSVDFVDGSSEAFAITPLGQLFLTVEPGESIDVEVVFEPFDAVSELAVLRILGDDTDNPSADISLSGNGIKPVIAIEPGSLNFGQLKVGETSTQKLLITNKGNAALTVTSAAISSGDGVFAVTAIANPLVIDPNGAAEVEITYTPTITGAVSAVLTIGSDDPENAQSEIVVSGEAIAPVLTALQQINGILAFYDSAVDGKTLYGVGHGKCGKAHLNAVRQMLVCSKKLIQGGYKKLALIALCEADKMTDGLGKPKDCLEGTAKAELNLKVKTLVKTIKTK